MPRDTTPPDPYTYGLAALSRRELTERQLRMRLARRGCEAAAVDAAIDRLRREQLLDDRRAARAYARTEARVKHRGPLRIRRSRAASRASSTGRSSNPTTTACRASERSLEAMGIDRSEALQAVDEGFEDRPVDEALEAALDRRVRGPIADDRHAQRLIGYLVRQGFDLGASAAAVRRRRRGDPE